MSYPEPHIIKNRLVFEQDPVVDGQRQEYKVLQLGFQDCFLAKGNGNSTAKCGLSTRNNW